MSLQVWLPLTGNLNNQGLIEPLIITNTNVTVDNNGQMGKCYSFNGSSSYLRTLCPAANYVYGEWSCSCWAKIANITNNMCIISSRKATGAGMSVFILAGKIRFDNGTDSANAQTQFTTLLTANVWQHICITQTTTKRLLYINGVLKETITGASTSSNTAQYLLVGASSSGDTTPTANWLNGSLNDLRIYDHCLTAEEVKSISQGLVIHYPLAKENSEATKNLYSGTFSNTCYNGATNKYGYGTTTDIYKTNGVFQGKQCTKVYMGTAGNDAYPYIYFDAFNAAGTTVQTLSFDYFPTSQNSIIPYSYKNPYDWSWVVNGVSGSRDNNATCATLPVKLNQWNHIVLTAHKTDSTDTTRGIGYIRVGTAKHTSTTTDYWLFANIQVEVKDHGTAYTSSQRGGQYDSAIYQESDGSLWVRMFHHNNPGNGLFAQADTFTTGVYKDADRWFDIYGVVSQLNSYEFMVKQKITSDATEVKYRWIQYTNPLTATWDDVAPDKVTRITTSGYTDGGYGGLWKMNTKAHMAIANTVSGNWYGAAGSWTAYQSGIPGYPNTTVTTGYIDLYARVDDLDFVKMYDISGFQNHGKIIGTFETTKQTKRYSNTVKFNGTDACIVVPYNTACPHNIFTLNLWFNKDALGTKTYETLFGGPSGFEMDTRSGSSTTLTLYMASTRGGSLWSSFSLNNWYMVTMVRDGTNEYYYINGELVNTIAAKSMPTGTYFIGAWKTAVQQNYYGLIADFRLYTTALDAAAIQDLYKMGV